MKAELPNLREERRGICDRDTRSCFSYYYSTLLVCGRMRVFQVKAGLPGPLAVFLLWLQYRTSKRAQ